MTQPAPGPATKGPIGQVRDAGQQALLSAITCGIYMLYWVYVTGEELKEHNREGIGGLVALLLTILAFIVGPLILASEIEKMYTSEGRESPLTVLQGLWVFLPIVGYYIYVNKAQTALNDYWVSKGATPPPAA